MTKVYSHSRFSAMINSDRKGVFMDLRASSQSSRFFLILVATAILTFVACGGGNSVGPTPTPTPVPSPTPSPTPSLINLRVENATVPPNGIYQYQLSVTEPKPMGGGSTGPSFASAPLLGVRGVAVNDPSGQASGIAVVNGLDVAIKLTSPNFTLGTSIDYPVLTLTLPVDGTATPGTSFPVSINAANSSFLDPNGQPYILEIAPPGTLTIGGTLSITDVEPGGGLLADRTMIRVLGLSFTANTKIAIEGTTIFPQDTSFISSTEIDVIICNGTIAPTATSCPNTGTKFQLDGERVRAIDQSTNTTVEYFSYLRADDVPGTSGNALVASVHPMFASQVTFCGGTLQLPTVLNGTKFTGLSLQNTTAIDAGIKLELLDSNNVSLVTPLSFSLPAGRKITRDVVADWFPSAPSAATKVKVTVTSGPAAIQMLGMQGDSSTGTVNPAAVTP
jgi:hypothetical protein